MNPFVNNRQYIVTGLPIDPKKKRYSNIVGDMPIQGETSDNSYLLQLKTAKADIIRKISENNSEIKREQDSYKAWAVAGDWDEAHRHSDRVEVIVAENAGLVVKTTAIDEEIKNVQARITAKINAQIAANILALATANLTPAQRAALEKQNAELEASKLKAASHSKIVKIIAIGSIILGVLGIVGFIVYEVKKSKS